MKVRFKETARNWPILRGDRKEMDQCSFSRAEFAIMQRYIQADLCTYGSKYEQYVDNYKENSKTLLICSFAISFFQETVLLMRTHSAAGQTTKILTTLIGSLGEGALLAVTQDRPAIIQVENPNLTFNVLQYFSFPSLFVGKLH